jgi:hypothetical protein
MRSEHAFEKSAAAEKRGGTGSGAYSAKVIAKTLGGTTITVAMPLAWFAPPTTPISSEEHSFMARMHRCL